ncbi:ATP-dependent zinc metalloprotease FtsH [Oceanivirga miroungae]|uniref:ATP-dependent zinc metalloprotease FtsH n=1 Tax=Oceanivirga miroungae TaxID=1130046 RepID=A0A6I8MEZ1_9FUSO|nr:ATP-dependent zinc metalloprotease FtsH [Oceanivirga miroungae]VWL85821.1 ATP-dependent metalloprotease FtsH [Oceanivirga miroungae]
MENNENEKEKLEEQKEENKEEKLEEKKEEKKDIEDEEEEAFRKKVEELKRRNGGKKPNISSLTFFLAIFLIVLSAYYFFGNRISNNSVKEVTYTNFIEKLKQGDISEVYEKEDNIYGKAIDAKLEYETKKITNRIGDDTTIMKVIQDKNVELKAVNSYASSIIVQIILNILPMIILIALFMFISRRIMGGGQGGVNPFTMGKAKARLKEKPNVNFKDIAGLDEEKKELEEVVDFLKDPTKFSKAGARVPKGVMLVGEPGTGKTLLAKAVAGESGASFFNISGSEFVEMYVGVGASRVRDLFDEAKKSKPAIIFIDEIDAIGRKRGEGRSGGNEEREQTLNQLLVEMDGFDTDTQIIVIAATNREDVLDKALLRSGRFDRKITVSAPDLKAREEILKVHAKGKKLSQDVKLEDIAKITPGYVGADLANILNEAAILAVRENREEITMKDLDEAVDKIGMGIGRRGKKISEYDLKLTAYHEGGHALMASLLPNADKVHKLTIIPRGNAGGYMMPLPKDEMYVSKNKILEEIMVSFGGRVAEELVMGDISTGASSDIENATRRAEAYVRYYGMSSLGPINMVDSQESYKNIISSETNREIDLEVRKILKERYEMTVELMKQNLEALDRIASLVRAKETITGQEVRALVAGKSVDEVMNMTTEELEEYY